VIETSAFEHDRQIAVSLGLTHFIGRALAETEARPQDIDTEGYRRLLKILEVVEKRHLAALRRYAPLQSACREGAAFVHGSLEEIEKRLASSHVAGFSNRGSGNT